MTKLPALIAAAVLCVSCGAETLKTPETSKLFVKYTDPLSGVVSYLLRPGVFSENQQGLYFTQRSMTDDGRFLLFMKSNNEFIKGPDGKKRKNGAGLVLVDFLKDEIVDLGIEHQTPFMDVKTDQVWYFAKSVEDGRQVRKVCRRDLRDDPLKEIVECPVPEELLKDVKKVSYLTTHPTLTRDRRKMFIACHLDERYEQGLINFDTGRWEPWGKTDFYANHDQLNPVRDDIAMVAWEACARTPDALEFRKKTGIYPRMWLVYPDGRRELQASKLPTRNYATHEHWAEDGKGFYWCASGVCYQDLATGEQTLAGPWPASHGTISADNRLVTFDCPIDKWYRGCKWRVGFWNRETKRGVYIHSDRPALCPDDGQWHNHPDPHPHFVCNDRYVVSTINNADGHMDLSLTPVAPLVERTAKAVEFPLEWNPTYDSGVPYEVEISPAKIERLAGLRNPAFQVVAIREDGNLTPPVTRVLEGREPGSVTLRFKLPGKVKSLVCQASSSPEPIVPAAPDPFGTALTSKEGWQLPKAATLRTVDGGIVLRNPGATGWARYRADVPKGWAGRPVRLELACRSLSKMVWGGKIRVAQLDAKGEVLPESVSDPRWTSHMRPSGKAVTYRESGRIHPAAKQLSFDIELRHESGISINAYGLPLADRSELVPELEITRLSLRPAAQLPFPKYRDDFFAKGVGGAAGDAAIVLGGERTFWFETRSQASWSEGVQLRKESQVFFPPAAGTMEAWLKADAWAKSGVQTIFENAHFGAKVETGSRYNETRGVLYGLTYEAAKKRLTLRLKDAAEKVFEQNASAELPVGAWFHLAAVWTPGKEAAVFVDGRRVLTMPIADYRPYDLAALKRPNDTPGVEFHLGASFRASRELAVRPASAVFFKGAADLLRISSGARYADDFTPSKTYGSDGKTRAFFAFDRTFDGTSGGGIGWISGTVRDFEDRVDHRLRFSDGREGWYWAEKVLPENDPDVVLDRLNYPEMPTEAEFAASRRTRRETKVMRPGETLTVDIATKAYPDCIEIANLGPTVLRYPALVNRGEIDPRSFGDIADSLGAAGLTDREKANAVFNFVLGASDYFMNHQPIFSAGSDCPRSVEYEALLMLNSYCGFECGPLNNLAANMFACAGGCPSSQTGGYGHSFEQVFYDGKNHIYDLSAQRFFPAMDNETAAYLEEDGQQPGCHYRIGASAGHFVRKSTRYGYVQTPAFQEKIAMSLNPGETIRVWFANCGACNDLQLNSCFCGNRRESPSRTISPESLTPYKEDYEARCHARCWRNTKGGPRPDDDLSRIDRFFPQYGNGFLLFDGRPTAENPAFAKNADGSFDYVVKSRYPIVAAEYAAYRADGSSVPLELTTDFKEMRPIALTDGVARLEYEVKARMAYRIRVKAPIEEVARFAAKTVVMVNARIYPGRVHEGRNELAFKATAGESARVTVQWRENAKPIAFRGAFANGAIPGYERHVALLDPAKGPLAVEVVGVSSAAKATATPGLKATLEGARLTVTAERDGFIGFVQVRDGEAEKELTVVVASNARLVPVGRTLATKGDVADVEYAKLPPGDYALWTLARWESRPDFWTSRPLWADFPERKTGIPAGGPCNNALMYYKARYGQPGGRAGWMWDHAIDPHSYYPYPLIRRLDLGGTSRVRYSLTTEIPNGVEVAAALVLPYPDQAFKCELMKVLGGLNCVPSRVK